MYSCAQLRPPPLCRGDTDSIALGSALLFPLDLVKRYLGVTAITSLYRLGYDFQLSDWLPDPPKKVLPFWLGYLGVGQAEIDCVSGKKKFYHKRWNKINRIKRLEDAQLKLVKLRTKWQYVYIQSTFYSNRAWRETRLSTSLATRQEQRHSEAVGAPGRYVHLLVVVTILAASSVTFWKSRAVRAQFHGLIKLKVSFLCCQQNFQATSEISLISTST